MFTQTYIEALLVDPDLADEVWTLWDAGAITDEVATIAWLLIRMSAFTNSGHSMSLI